MQTEWHKGEFTISTDQRRMQLDVIHGYLSRTYWAKDIPRATVERSMANSLCFGIFRGDEQVGFARAVSDRATFAWLGDVFVLEKERGHGLSKWLVETILAHPELQGLRRFNLATQDAHTLYARFGFKPLATPERHMERLDLEAYTRPARASR